MSPRNRSRIKQSPDVLGALRKLDRQRKKLYGLYQAMSSVYGGKIYPVDLLATGAVKRSISTAAGFTTLVRARNILCSRALLRIQIDTALRFFSIWLVEDPHRYSTRVLSGERIDLIQDKTGNMMNDRYLIKKLKPEHPWLPKVYKSLSGYIHFSAEHYFSTIREVRDDERTGINELSIQDTKYPDWSWLEMIECFREATNIFANYLEGWVLTKANPEIVSKMKEKLQEAGIQDLSKVFVRITKARR